MPPPSTPVLTSMNIGRGSVTSIAGCPEYIGTGSLNCAASAAARAPAQLSSGGAQCQAAGGRDDEGVAVVADFADRRLLEHLCARPTRSAGEGRRDRAWIGVSIVSAQRCTDSDIACPG